MTENGAFNRRELVIECYAGISGDMLASALHGLVRAAGLDTSAMEGVPRTIAATLPSVHGIRAGFTTVRNNGLAATYLDMTVDEHHDHGGTSIRTVKENLDRCIDSMGFLSNHATTYAREVLDLLASAEASVHGVGLSRDDDRDQTHLHELASADTLVDILLVASALDLLGAVPGAGSIAVRSTPVSTGSGTVKTAHGVLPVPAPGTLSILERARIPHVTGPVPDHELATPTGVALLSALHPVFSLEGSPGIVLAVGTGTGTKRFPGVPNVLRVRLVERDGARPVPTLASIASAVQERAGYRCMAGKAWQVQAIIDDATMEEVGFLIDKSYDLGAHEVLTCPVHMKKARTGVEITILCNADLVNDIAGLWLGEGTTIGCRIQEIDRVVLDRVSETIEISLERAGRRFDGRVRVKRLVPAVSGQARGGRPGWKVEHDDVSAVAAALHVSYFEARRMIGDVLNARMARKSSH